MSVEFLTVLGGAVGLKLVSSADDVVWLAKLFEGLTRYHLLAVCTVYILTISFICVLAYGVAGIGTEGFLALTGEEGWFSMAGSVLLLLFAITVLRHEDDDEDFDIDTTAGTLMRMRDAFVISFIGSLDELAVYTVALSTGEIMFFPLLAGTIIAGLLTVLVVRGLRISAKVTEVLEKLPFWILVAGLAVIGIGLSGWELFKP